jgi:hypothetical protein
MRENKDVYVQMAAARLNWEDNPNVSFPVLKGEPRAGSSGYNARSISAAFCKAVGWTMGGEKFAMSQSWICCSELNVVGMKIVPGG